ncbi:MAG: ABC transporter permease/substrate-binding protein [Vicinamibacteria bacterium]
MSEFISFVIDRRSELGRLAIEHLAMSALATLAAALIGLPLGIFLTRRPRWAVPVLGLANVVQTIPSLALFGLLIPLPFIGGIGPKPAIFALIVYAVLPILRNTYDGIRGVDPALREAAEALGLKPMERLGMIELPLAMPVILGGVRLAAVLSVGTATIAAAVGAGGLGTYVLRGIATVDTRLVLAGAIPAALLAVFVDAALGALARSARPMRSALILVVLAALSSVALIDFHPRGQRVVVGSKNFTESVLLGEIVAATLESRGLSVERHFNLGGAWLCHRALISGDLDVYVEYSGTALMDIFKRPKETDRATVLSQVHADYEQAGLTALSPLGYENNFALVVRKEDAEKFKLSRISDLQRVQSQFRLGMFGEFLERADGFPGLARAYGLAFAHPPTEMDLGLLYQALESDRIDLAVGSTTDGLIAAKGFVVLEDDRHYFPPYDALPVVRTAALAEHLGLAEALSLLTGHIDAATMRRLNFEVDGRKRDPKDVAREFIKTLAVPSEIHGASF